MNNINNKQLLQLLKQKLNALEKLEKQNDEFNRQLKILNGKLQESENFKSHFISNVTNEIINPFSSVMGLSKSIMNLKSKDLIKAPALASLIYSEAAFLDFQLSNIFAAAKIEAGEIAVESSTVNVQDVIESAIRKLKHEIDKKKLNVNIDVEINEGSEKLYYFKTDHEKLQLIIVNLLSNAIKASEEKQYVYIKAQLKNEKLILSITDNGCGIGNKELKRIFDRFHRINSNINSLNPGNGLGLSVVKGLIDILEGDISIDSTTGKGTVVTFIIPENSEAKEVFDSDLFGDMEEEETF